MGSERKIGRRLHVIRKWTKCRCIYIYISIYMPYMDPMDMLTWSFVTFRFLCVFQRIKTSSGKCFFQIWGPQPSLWTMFKCMSNLKYLEEQLDDSEVNISSIFTSPSGNIFHSCSKTLISIPTNHSNTYSQKHRKSPCNVDDIITGTKQILSV